MQIEFSWRKYKARPNCSLYLLSDLILMQNSYQFLSIWKNNCVQYLTAVTMTWNLEVWTVMMK